jgi:hypothetical protein
MRAGAILWQTETVFGISKDFSNIINSVKLHLDRSRRLGFTGGRNLYAIEEANGPYHVAKRYRAGRRSITRRRGDQRRDTYGGQHRLIHIHAVSK